jgi:hypothetical protein
MPGTGSSDSKPVTTPTVQNDNKDDKIISTSSRVGQLFLPQIDSIISPIRELFRTPTPLTSNDPQTRLKFPPMTNPIRR